MSEPGGPWRRLGVAGSVVVIAALCVYATFPLLRCLDSCFIDYRAIHGVATGSFEIPDARLNAWILAWDHHAAIAQPGAFFAANSFFPERHSLTGSEHLIGVALQALPAAVFSSSPIALHQFALVLSFFVLALNTFALVRWASGHTWAALAAAATTLFMPWRFSELGHLQLLSAQWFPLIWLLIARIALGARSWRDTGFLALVLSVQMLSSFYLAYFALYSAGVLALGLLVQVRFDRAALARLAAAFAAPCVVVALLALPYLTRLDQGGFAAGYDFVGDTDPATMWAFIAPTGSLLADRERMFAGTTYYIPLVVFALAAAALFGLTPKAQRAVGDASTKRLRALVASLSMVAVASFVMMLGTHLQLGNLALSLPAGWAAKFVPGFSQMRAEFRWASILGMVFPALAGLGIAALDRLAARTFGKKRAPRHIVLALAGVALAVNTPWFQLPARAAWSDVGDISEASRSLAALPSGPGVSLPWPLDRVLNSNLSSAYQLSSATDWRPILNGYTGYPPATHELLQRIAQQLPARSAIDRLQALSGLRWVTLHVDRLAGTELARWDAAVREGRLKLRVSRSHFRIYELPETAQSGRWLEKLTSAKSRARTLTDLARSPIVRSDDPGRLAVALPDVLLYEPLTGIPTPVTVEIENHTNVAWPGLDLQPEGLVLLRYRFLSSEGREAGRDADQVVWESTAPLDLDVPPHGTVVAQPVIRAPTRSGRYGLRFDLVQRIGEEWVPLGVPAVELKVQVKQRSPIASR